MFHGEITKPFKGTMRQSIFKGNLAARNFWPRIPLMQNFFEKSSRHKFIKNMAQVKGSKVMNHAIF